MKREKFLVIDFTRNLILNIDTELENFPKKDIEIKNRLRKNSYDLLELEYEANETQDLKLKMELLHRVKSKIKIVDFLLNLSYDKKLITEKKYNKLSRSIEDILKFTIGWQNKIPIKQSV